MIFILLATLVVLFIASYYFGGRDFLSPTTIQIITFLFACLMCMYFLYDSGLTYELHYNTVFILSTCLTMSVCIGIFVHQLFRRVKITSDDFRVHDMVPAAGIINVFVLAILMIIIIWSLYEVRRIVGYMGDYSSMMFQFRNLNSHSNNADARLPFLLRNLRPLSSGFFILYFFQLVYFFDILSPAKKSINILIITMCAVVQLQGGERTSTINCLLACVMIYHLLRIKKHHGYKTYSFKFIIIMILICCISLWSFSFLRGVAGRRNNTDVMHYISGYAGPPIVNLDLYLQDPFFNTDIFGKYTFYRLISNLRTLGADIPYYTIHREYRAINGINLGNVYTAMGIYYADFGLGGVYVLYGLSSFLISILYEYVKKYRGNLLIIFFSLIYYSFVLVFFADRFFSSIFSISFAAQWVLVVIFYKLLLNNKVRVMINWRK